MNRVKYIIFFFVLLLFNLGSAQNALEISRDLIGTKGTYALPPLTKNGAIDYVKLIKQLKDIHANTYHWLAWGASSDIEAFKKFIPIARKAKIKVWITLVPPSECPPFAKDYSEPYRLDYKKWAVELANLSLTNSNFVAWSIDDFVHNLKLFTPNNLSDILSAAKLINPKFSFIPCCYYKQCTTEFAKNYKQYLDGILFPYRNESISANLKDANQAKFEIDKLRDLFGKNVPVFIDIYASDHSQLGSSTPEYVSELINTGLAYADGVLIYCHQDPDKFPEKYEVIKEGFRVKNKQNVR